MTSSIQSYTYQPLADVDPLKVYIASLTTVNSRRVMYGALEAVAQVFGQSADRFNWGALRYQHVQAIRTRMSELYAPSTANHHMAALRGVLKEAWRLGYMSAEDYHRAVDVKPIKGERETAGTYIERETLDALLSTCQRQRAIDARDAAILVTLYMTGLRRDELVSVVLADYHRDTLTVIGKGNKQRSVPVNVDARRYAGRWLEWRGHDAGALFTAIDKHGNVTLRKLTTQAVFTLLARRCNRVGIEQLTPHDFRHTFISNLFDSGVDIATIAQLAGHSSVEVTRRYDRRPERARREAVERLNYL